MTQNLVLLCIIILGLALAIYKGFKTKSLIPLSIVPFWFYLGWGLLSARTLSMPFAVVLLVVALAIRIITSRKSQQPERTEPTLSLQSDDTNMSAREFTDESAGLNADLDISGHDGLMEQKQPERFTYNSPNELPYEIISEIDKPAWQEMMRHARNPELNNAAANEYMWGHLYRLHSWYYINLGGPLSIRPYCAIPDGKPSLMLFTSPQIAHEFIVSNGIADRDEAVSVDGFIFPGTLPFVQSFADQGVEWVAFNQGPDGAYGGPINLLQVGYKWHMENDSRFRKTGDI